MKIDQDTLQKTVEELTKRLADEGKLMEAGWVGFASMVIPNSATQGQRDDMRAAFFAGGHFLLSSVVSMLDPEAEPTDNDIRRIDLISREMFEFFRLQKKGAADA